MRRRPLPLLDRIVSRWPAARQAARALGGGSFDTSGEPGEDVAISDRTRSLRSRLHGVRTVPSVCPYCAVGCGTLVHTRDGQVVDVEGDPDSPINEGTLCPKGAGIFQYTINPRRLTKTLYRRPYGTEWEEVDLEWAMDRIARRFAESRERTWVAEDDEGCPVRHTSGVGFLGGAALDNEENYLIKKFCVGSGIVHVENQARI